MTPFLALLTLTTVFSPIPAAAAGQLDPPPDATVAVDPASQPYDLPPQTQPLSDESSLPLIDLSELQGIWPEDIPQRPRAVVEPGS